MATDPVKSSVARLRRTAVALAVSLAGAVAFTYWLEKQTAPTVVVSGKADVSGSFRLRGPADRVVTDREFRGRVMVVYFGWRLDPDITPAALQVLAAALARLGPKSQQVAPVFISLDPERDSPTEIAEYLDRLGLRATGLVGTPAETSALAAGYKLYHKRLPDASLPGGYSIDHASLYYIFGADGDFRGIVPHTTEVQALVEELRRQADLSLL